MPRNPGPIPKGEFAFFNVVYEDGSQRSNRRVPSELLGGLDGDEPARGYIMEQDREIAEKSGRTLLADHEHRTGRREEEIGRRGPGHSGATAALTNAPSVYSMQTAGRQTGHRQTA